YLVDPEGLAKALGVDVGSPKFLEAVRYMIAWGKLPEGLKALVAPAPKVAPSIIGEAASQVGGWAAKEVADVFSTGWNWMAATHWGKGLGYLARAAAVSPMGKAVKEVGVEITAKAQEVVARAAEVGAKVGHAVATTTGFEQAVPPEVEEALRS